MLARELGYASPRRMLGEMTPTELGEWLAEYSISPWGEWRDDLRAAQITAMIANVNRDAKRKPQPFQPRDFMYDHVMEERDAAKRSALLSAQIKSALKGRTVKRGKK